MIALQLLLSAMLPALLGVGMVQVTPKVVPDPQALEKAAASRELSETSDRNEDVALGFLRSAFSRVGTGGRVYYAADRCQGDFDLIPFPALRVHSPSAMQADLPTVREMFADDSRVAVSDGPGGLIDIRIGEVPDEFLRTPIAHIEFDPDERFNELLALGPIRNAKAVVTAAHRLHLGQPSLRYESITSFSGPVSELSHFPHLPRAMKNVTLDEALDRVAKTFSGIVVFRYCADKRLYEIGFTGGYEYDDGLPEQAK